jgi:hypothetical protein
MSNDGSTEPLLIPSAVAADPTMLSHSSSINTIHGTSRKHRIWPLLLLLILVHLSTVLYTLPLNRVIELRLCEEHYALHDPSSIPPNGLITEKLCKINEVQRKLAWLQGIMETTLVVCGTLWLW